MTDTPNTSPPDRPEIVVFKARHKADTQRLQKRHARALDRLDKDLKQAIAYLQEDLNRNIVRVLKDQPEKGKQVDQTAMISGHLDLTREEFDDHYAPAIQQAIDVGCEFVVGDARGTDTMAQTFLFVHLPLQAYRSRVAVYHMFSSPRNVIGTGVTKGGYLSHTAKDAAMTADSDYDILWVRPGKETSGTARNLIRRRTEKGKK